MNTKVFMFLLFAMFGIAGIATGAEPVEYSETTHMVQVRLADSGFDPGLPDGLIGLKTKNAILRYEEQHGMLATGTVSEDLLKRLGLHALHQIRNIRIRGELIELEPPTEYCQLVDGFGKCGNAEVTIKEFIELGDLNADNVTDIVAIFQAYWGGNSPPWYLVSALKQGNVLTEMSIVGITGAFSLNIDRSGKIILRDLIHRDDEPRCCPTRPVETYYRVKKGKLEQEGERELTDADVSTLILSLQRRTERRGAAIALGVIGGKDAITALTHALAFKDSGFYDFHIASLQALGRIGKDATNALPTIRRSTQHDNEIVRSAAVEVIATIERTSQRESIVSGEIRRILGETEDSNPRQRQIEEDFRTEIIRMTEVVERCGDMVEVIGESMQADNDELLKLVKCHMQNRGFGVLECQWIIDDILISIQRTKDLMADFREECDIVRIDPGGREFFDAVKKHQKDLVELESMLEKIRR